MTNLSGIFNLAWKALRPRLQHLSLRDLKCMLILAQVLKLKLQPRLSAPLLSNYDDLTWMPIFSWLRFYNF